MNGARTRCTGETSLKGSPAKLPVRYCKRSPTEAVWITLDKDVLPEQEALSNWDQGRMPLSTVLELIGAMDAAKRVLGTDVCDEYSPRAHANLFKRAKARLDQPRRAAIDAARLARNRDVNRALTAALFAACTRTILQ